ncbi:hypothetical protein RCH09_003595 [Actimicrobium sp. GrIS 1.19]|uniref:hypothetical protein n=1 Tax=Actimicrobium sp. GrIS 1.19 TaxID=3071708 RepID=UPI002DFC139F|nr:hypothetical protein [Actimicrobium sp. GrIS 1.19]
MHIPTMNFPYRSLLAGVALTMLVAACEQRASTSGSAATAPVAPTVPETDKWLGKWIGPEATFVQLAGGNGKYDITIQNLDGPRTFKGSAVGSQIVFERDGVKESIHATNGAETGMKWLSEKTNCLTVRAGEGYCRE